MYVSASQGKRKVKNNKNEATKKKTFIVEKKINFHKFFVFSYTHT